MTTAVRLTINGVEREADAWEGESLLYFLRERLGYFGSKNACEQGECGSCSVFLDGELVCACLILAATAAESRIETVEAMEHDPVGEEVQRAMVEAGGVQCGFCTPGFIVAMTALLKRNPRPDEYEVREALSGNLCRCTGYVRIFDALQRAAAALQS
jgi:carbon-monoxide dehydrogenase small subunit